MLDLLLANTPEERLRRKLERQLKPYHNLICYSYLVLTAKRPTHSLAIVLTLFSIIRVLFYFSLPVLSFVFIFLSFVITLWWLSELIYISIPWERILSEMDKEPRDPFDTLARIKLKYEDLSQKYSEMKKVTDPAKVE